MVETEASIGHKRKRGHYPHLRPHHRRKFALGQRVRAACAPVVDLVHVLEVAAGGAEHVLPLHGADALQHEPVGRRGWRGETASKWGGRSSPNRKVT